MLLVKNYCIYMSIWVQIVTKCQALLQIFQFFLLIDGIEKSRFAQYNLLGYQMTNAPIWDESTQLFTVFFHVSAMPVRLENNLYPTLKDALSFLTSTLLFFMEPTVQPTLYQFEVLVPLRENKLCK